MPRKPFVVGNWKMNLRRAEAAALARAAEAAAEHHPRADVAVAPSPVLTDIVREGLGGGPARLAAQNMYFEAAGAFTGECSPTQLLDAGVTLVILGHSERRSLFGEDDGLVNRKLRAALAHGLGPILCVGETLAQRQANATESVIGGQLRAGLSGVPLEQARQVTIAYEPVWAIGTGQVATPEQAQAAHAHLRGVLTEIQGVDLAQVVRILYGGSVKADNAAGLFAKPDIDGALVGGASLVAADFLAIVAAAAGG